MRKLFIILSLILFVSCSTDEITCAEQKSELYESYSKRIRDLRVDGNWEQADLLIIEMEEVMDKFICD